MAKKIIKGTKIRPRLSVYRSLEHVYAQIIDDAQGKTLAVASTLDPRIKDKIKSQTRAEAARQVGTLIAKDAKEKGIEKVVFDRSRFRYHGRVKALAEAAREGGLQF